MVVCFFCVMALVQGLYGPMFRICLADATPQLPDLTISPDDIVFSYYGDTLDYGVRGLPIDIGVTVHNAGPGNSSSANVTLFIDGAFSAIIHVNGNITAGLFGNESTVHFTWDTTDAASGNHTIRAVANDTAGDATPADNGAERVFRIHTSNPAITLSLSPNIRDASVTPTDSASVQFDGTVHLNLGDWEEAILSLTASVDQGWAAALAPGIMVFISDGFQHFINFTLRQFH
jgi:hypothetical protein